VVQSAAARKGARQPAQHDEYVVQTLVRGLDVLHCFTPREPEWSVPEIAARTGLNRTSAFRFLYTLAQLGLVEEDRSTHRFRLSVGVLELGFDFLNSLPFVERAEPYLRRLRDEVGESCHLGVLDDDEVLFLSRAAIDHMHTASSRVGARLPAHSTAIGRVLLAHLSPERLEEILSRADLRPTTPYSSKGDRVIGMG